MVSALKNNDRQRGNQSLQTRLITYTVILLSLLMIVTTYLGIKRESKSIFNQMQKDGIALAKSFALGAENALLLQRAGLSRVAGEASRTKGIEYLQIVDRERIVIGHTDISKMGTKVDDSLYSNALNISINAVERGDKPINLISKNKQGEDIFRVIVPLVTLDSIGGVLEIGLDMTEISKAIMHTNYQSLFIAVVALLGGVVFIWFFARSLTRPIKALADAAGKVAAGDLNHTIHSNGKDEIGQLASSFNFMTEKLREYMGDLTKTNEDLEAQITLVKDLHVYIENILNSITVGMLTVDLDSSITYLNNAGMKILLLEKTDIVGKKIEEVLSRDHFIIAALNEMENSSRTYQGHEIKTKKASEGETLLSLNTAFLFDQHSDIVGYAFTFEDVTEVRQLQGRVQHTQKMVAMGRLAAGIAHEVRNPLGAIKTCAQYLESKSEPEDPKHQFSQLIVREVKRVDQLVERLLNFTRPADWDFQYEDINKLIENAVDLAALKIDGSNIEIKKGYADKLPRIFVDAKRLSLAVFNILLNAIDAVGVSGSLNIKTSFNEKNQTILISISDTGKGIPKDELGNIFNPFYTTRAGGTGLGLAIVQQIVVEHSGTIDVNSKIGEGTTFTIILPLSQEHRPVESSEAFI